LDPFAAWRQTITVSLLDDHIRFEVTDGSVEAIDAIPAIRLAEDGKIWAIDGEAENEARGTLVRLLDPSPTVTSDVYRQALVAYVKYFVAVTNRALFLRPVVVLRTPERWRRRLGADRAALLAEALERSGAVRVEVAP
jgi:hypothetical protein